MFPEVLGSNLWQEKMRAQNMAEALESLSATTTIVFFFFCLEDGPRHQEGCQTENPFYIFLILFTSFYGGINSFGLHVYTAHDMLGDPTDLNPVGYSTSPIAVSANGRQIDAMRLDDLRWDEMRWDVQQDDMII